MGKNKDTANVGNLNTWLGALEKPIEAGLSTGDMQKQYNQLRNQIQGSWGTGAESLKGELGQRGFRVGESGMADTALAGLYSQGSKALSKGATDIYLSEADKSRELANMNLQRKLGAGGLITQQAQARASGAGARAAMAGLDWEKEKFEQTFPWEQEQFYTNQAMDLAGRMGQSQQQVYAPYLDALGNYATQ